MIFSNSLQTYLYNSNYNCGINDKIQLKINGFSLGGPISQLFILLITEKYYNLNIEMYNIESWFGGNEEIYDKMKQNINIVNIYNNKSIIYLFNYYFQRYFKSDQLIETDDLSYLKLKEYNRLLFPCGIINYMVDNHLLSEILK